MINGKPGSFWHYNIGHIMTLIGVIVTVGIPLLVGTCSMRDSLRDNVTKTTGLQATLGVLDLKVSAMDVGGTQFSRSGIPKEAELIRSQNERIEFITKQIGDISPKVVTMERDMSWLRAFLENEKQMPNPEHLKTPHP